MKKLIPLLALTLLIAGCSDYNKSTLLKIQELEKQFEDEKMKLLAIEQQPAYQEGEYIELTFMGRLRRELR